MPTVAVYVSAEIWRLLEARGLDPAVEVRRIVADGVRGVAPGDGHRPAPAVSRAEVRPDWKGKK